VPNPPPESNKAAQNTEKPKATESAAQKPTSKATTQKSKRERSDEKK
jgi:hypothetical protein